MSNLDDRQDNNLSDYESLFQNNVQEPDAEVYDVSYAQDLGAAEVSGTGADSPQSAPKKSNTKNRKSKSKKKGKSVEFSVKELFSRVGAAVSGVCNKAVDAVLGLFEKLTGKKVSPKSSRAETGSKGKPKKKPVSKKNMTKKQRIWNTVLKVFVMVTCICVVAGCALMILLSVYLVNVTENDNELLDLNSLKLSYSTLLLAYNDDTGEWEEYQRIYGEENRVWVSYDQMPQHLIDAVVASEDARFWRHHGVDWKRTIGAFINILPGVNLWSTNQGGSTLYQQLIKNLTGDDATSGLDGILRKVREIYRALVMDRNYTKEQVLEAYLNTFRLSGTVAGIESGANYYFGKTTSELTVAECAAIVCITKSPVAYNPFTNPETNREQRELVLWNMMDQGYLTEEEYNAAMAESATMVFYEGSYTGSSTEVWSWFTDTAVREVISDLQTYGGYTAAEANDLFYNGGLTVYLTIDTGIQDAIDQALLNEDEDWVELTTINDDGEEERLEGAILIMNYKGELLGLAGSMYEKTESLNFNRAVDMTRGTGSSMKPIAVYAPAIELDKINYSTLISDTPITIEEEGKMIEFPRNYDNVYGNPVTVNVGVQRSLNTVAIHVMQMIGFDFSFDFLVNRLGISTLVETYYDTSQGKYVGDRTLSLALGGLTYGCTMYEMCAAYAVFGNAGLYTEPHCYTKVVDANGNVILDREANVRTIQAISEDTAYIMNRILREVLTSGTGTAARRYYRQVSDDGMALAGKSGTTSDNNDLWFIGMNPYYVCGIWAGYDSNEYIENIRPHPIQVIWGKLMGTISQDLDPIDFPTSDGVLARTYCTISGLLATDECVAAGATATGYYKSTNIPGYCTHSMYYDIVPSEA